MRFLCLHGASTNGEIFEIQTGGLRQKLEKDGHRFTFMNGRLPSQVEEGLEGVVDGPFYSHYPRDPALPSADVLEAFEHVQRIIDTEGPFDAVIGFSQGAALASAMLVHHTKTNPAAPPPFRVAVFLCGGRPWNSSGMAYVEPQPDTYLINIPTAHVVGKLDPLYEQGLVLHALCEPSKAKFYDHGSKHMVPFDQKNTDEMVKIIEETIAKAIRG
ncbi:Serine hydrolase FSH [Penicillium macrosclerotiorum]|uniref:Serine hydrolase FSH n=1 Tax=Penicillium macrosclerotiorum TaxID=303699 RepID=UPI002547FC32|nr:Serine hydrolase FSH [Penicillium macrosclerotiorum]KAJ5699006.1 Serine hydrolase FSH [Penicillium macrosclerotiorum]